MIIDLLTLKRLAYFVALLIVCFSTISCGHKSSSEGISGVWIAEDFLYGVLYKHVLQIDTMDTGGWQFQLPQPI
ncbi:hypothetical protein SAMN05421747_11727 [Parapedobacter composti]|uniref:Uncharacterized protein n=1 Tax=Parapedobacter composti TaxID=623281 RepID=A0A1I1KTP6_9SPHI|nr:hypothetical protein SAMN05421747_11727 [Parapedobacter composti]